MTYRERPTGVPGATLWRASAATAPTLVLPDGCLDLLLIGERLVVAGPDRTAREVAGTGTVLGLRLAGGRGPRLLGVPAHELTDTLVDLSALWSPRAAGALRGRVLADPPGALVAWAAGADDRVAAGVFADAARGLGVDAIAARAGVTPRTLLRRSRAAFGYGPQHLVRVLRLQRALALARDGVGWAAAAARTGYADQPHLARDARALAGHRPGDLVAERRASEPS